MPNSKNSSEKTRAYIAIVILNNRKTIVYSRSVIRYTINIIRPCNGFATRSVTISTDEINKNRNKTANANANGLTETGT